MSCTCITWSYLVHNVCSTRSVSHVSVFLFLSHSLAVLAIATILIALYTSLICAHDMLFLEMITIRYRT